MIKRMMLPRGFRSGSWVLLLALGAPACAIRHTIEPSDKPLVVNLNVKIDHEVKVKVEEQHQDLLNLEEEYLKSKKAKKKGKVAS